MDRELEHYKQQRAAADLEIGTRRLNLAALQRELGAQSQVPATPARALWPLGAR